MSLRNASTATPEAIQRLAEMNLDMAVQIRELKAQVAAAAVDKLNDNRDTTIAILRAELETARQKLKVYETNIAKLYQSNWTDQEAMRLLVYPDAPDKGEKKECIDCGGDQDEDGSCEDQCNGGYPSLTNGGYE